MRVGRLTQLRIVQTVLTIAGLTALIWLGIFQTHRANILAARHAPGSEPGEHLKQTEKNGGTSDNQGDDVSKIIGIATLVILLGQSLIFVCQAGLMRRQADIMDRQTGMMNTQHDLSLVAQRAWIRALVKVDGPIRADADGVHGFFALELFNSGSLPAYMDFPNTAGLAWDMNPATSDEPRIDHLMNRYKKEPVARQGVIFPQQTIIEHIAIFIQKAVIDAASNMTTGFVPIVRGVVRYNYPGNTQTRFTTFHAHVLRTPDASAPAFTHPIPTDDGAVVPADELFVTNRLGKTEAT